MKEKQVRTCSVCNESGHNSRTCPAKTVTTAPTPIPSAIAIARPEEANRNVELPSLPKEQPPTISLLEPVVDSGDVSYSEQTIQEYANGVSLRLAYREYNNGDTVVRLKVSSDPSSSKEIQIDIPSAAKLLQMLTITLQKHYVAEQQKRAVARTPKSIPYEHISRPDEQWGEGAGTSP